MRGPAARFDEESDSDRSNMVEHNNPPSIGVQRIPPPPDKPRLLPLSELLGEWQADAEAAHEAYTRGLPRGPLTGLTTLDRELGGALWPGMHVWLGNTGTGKTALTLQVAASCGLPAVLLTTEMAPWSSCGALLRESQAPSWAS